MKISLSPITHRPFTTYTTTTISVAGEESTAHKTEALSLRKKKKGLEDLSDEFYKLTCVNLDHAPARRQLRSFFFHFHQHLDHVLFKLAPPGIRTKEWYELNSKGQEIFCKSWLPIGDQIKGIVCFCHGYGDTCTFLFEGIARRIAGSGYGVYAVDHPGFGLSDGLHGYISNFDDLVDNIIEQYAKISERPELQGLPRFILGQSMGGAVALKTHLKKPDLWDGMILVGPMCRVAKEVMPPAAVLRVANILTNVIPEFKFLPTKDLAELCFRNLKYRKLAYYNVISYSGHMRLKTSTEILRVTREIEENVSKVSSPLLVIHGAADMVTDPNVSKYLYEKASSDDKTLKLYEGGYHSILEGEPDEAIFRVFNDIVEWLDARCSS